MRIFQHQKTVKALTYSLLICFGAQCVSPTIAVALTNGPSQPEFSVFEPVGSTNMVNEFTGAFTYNIPVVSIPGPNGSGYALSLSYHSGVSAEDDASWVGHGWTLNPGAITRVKRGFPDDYNGATVEYWNKVPENWTATLGAKGALEVFSAGVSANVRSSFNNYKGFSHTYGFGLSALGWVNLGFSNTDGETSYSGSINPYKILMAAANAISTSLDGEKTIRSSESSKPSSFEDKILNKIMNGPNFQLSTGSAFGYSSFGEINRSTNFPLYQGKAYTFDAGIEADPAYVGVGFDVGLSGSYSIPI